MNLPRAILVGCGGISARWLKALEELQAVELTGLVDLSHEAATARADEFKLQVPVFTNLDDALTELSPEIAFDCTIPEAHAATDIRLMEAGCDVLCEKPLAHSLEAAARVVRVARDTGRTHAVMQNRRYLPDIQRFHALLGSGLIGETHTLNADFYIGAHFGGFRAEMEHVLLLDMAIHTFDAARYLLGSRPQTVTCVEWNPPGSWYEHGAAATATFVMDDQTVFSYRGNWAAEGLNTSWEAHWRAVATRGSAQWDGASAILAERAGSGETLIRPAEPVAVPMGPVLEHQGHEGCIADFLGAVREGTTPMTVSRDNIYSLAMSLAAIESAENGGVVTINLEES